MTTKRPLLLASATCLLHFAGISTAQDNPAAQPGDQPAEMLITANRFSQLRADTHTAHSVIDSTAIRRSAAQSLFDVLSTLPGMQLARTGVEGSQTSLFLRGSNSNHTLILLDGVRLNTASEGAARLENIPLDSIDRIEVVRGPQSSLYGADAIGGVVQIFTRKDVAAESLAGELRLGSGTEQTRLASAALSGRTASTSLHLNLSHRQTDGIPSLNAPMPSTEDADYQNQSASLRLNHQFDPQHSVSLSWQSSDAEKTFDGGDSEADSQTIALSLHNTWTDQWQSRLQLSRFRDANITRSFGEARSTTRRESLQWQHELTLSSNSNSVVGLDVDRESLDYQNPGAVLNQNSRDNVGLFAVHQQSWGDWSSTLSARHDDNEQFGKHQSGRLSLGRHLGDHSNIWLAAGTAYKAPTMLDLYVDFPDFWFYANPDLQPEKARNLELGFNTHWFATDLTVNVFRNDIRDLIGTDTSFTTLANISRARIDGSEITMNRDLFGWQTMLSLTWLDHENRATGQRLVRRPDRMLNLQISRQFERLSVLLDWQANGSRADLDPVDYSRSRVAGYGLLDSVISWQFSDQLSVQLKVGNVFDQQYEVVDGYNTLGRHALLTVNQGF
ncbi:TonB-dependent receptor domain-containing protein [Pseudohongiella spirulinae]|uniref:TonB-dependent receptor n=1 Tax=Pseudohongiella spirulinae TaxID=1249552 RepID=A0A0S2KFW6_9GAMM|nr:TonB-dependent receptor [Pseudohongiella spirulinae]ALO47211.1 hypothetical protein PS2015_2578 [Pseudohongiella spirulinae]